MYFSKLLVADILEYADSKGAPKAELLRSLKMKLNSKTDALKKVSYDKMVEVLNTTGQSINDELLGLHLGEQIILKGTQQVDQIMQTSPTIKEAFNNAISYSKLISDAMTSHMEQTDLHTKVSFELNPNWEVLENEAVKQIIDMTLVCTQKSIFWLTGKKYPPVEVHLPYASKKKRNEYYRVFDCAVKFNKPIAAIVFHNPVLNQSVPTYDLGLLASLKKIGAAEIKKQKSENELVLQIKKAVLHKLPQKSNLHFIASELNMSTRSLQRKLQILDTNFKKVEKEILLKLARKLILHDERSIEEISYLLGFSESSSFIRFFNKEMNVSPRLFKKSQKNE